MTTREKNYWDGHPRAQAATDAVLGGIGGTIIGYVAAAATMGIAVATADADEPGTSVGLSFGAIMLPLVGGITGAYLAASRKRAGFSETQRKKAGKGAAIGSIVPFVGAPAGTFYATERANNPKEVRRLRNSLCK